MLDIGEVQFRRAGDRRLGPDLGDGDLLFGSRFFGSGRLGGDGGGFGVFAFALARFEDQRHPRAGHPALHRGLNFTRRQRGEDFQLVGEIIGIVGQHFAGGQSDGLAAETADLFEATDRAGDGAGSGTAHFVFGRAGADEIGDQFVEALFHDRRIDARARSGTDIENPDALEAEIAGRDTDGQLLVTHQRVVETAGGKAAEDLHPHGERGQLAVEHAGRGPVFGHIGRRDLVLHHRADIGGKLGNFRHRRLVHRATRDRTEILLDHRARLFGRDVAGEDQRGVVRAVIVAEPVLHRVHRRRVEIGHRTDRRVIVGVGRGEERVDDLVEDEAARLVVALTLLVLDDSALVIELLLRHRAEQIAHAVAFQPERAFESGGRDGLEIICAVEIGGAVVIGGTHFLQILEIVFRRVFRTVEHQMFEQVRKAAFALGLVLRADIVPHGDRHDRRLAIGVDDHVEPILKRELLVRNLDLVDQRGEFGGLCRRHVTRIGHRRGGSGRARHVHIGCSGGAGGKHERCGARGKNEFDAHGQSPRIFVKPDSSLK